MAFLYISTVYLIMNSQLINILKHEEGTKFKFNREGNKKLSEKVMLSKKRLSTEIPTKHES